MITSEQKQRILEAITANRANYPSDAKHAASLGIATSVYSAIKNGQTDKALSEANWITIARRLGVNLEAVSNGKQHVLRHSTSLQPSWRLVNKEG